MSLLAISQNMEAEEKVQRMFTVAGTLDIMAYLSDSFVYVFMNKKIFQLLQIAWIRKDNRISNTVSFCRETGTTGMMIQY